VRVDNRGNVFLQLRFVAALAERPTRVELDLGVFDTLPRSHKSLVRVMTPGMPMQQAVFTAERSRRAFAARDPRGPFVRWLQRSIGRLW